MEQIISGRQPTIPIDSFGKEVIWTKTAFGDSVSADLMPIIQQSFEYTVSNTDLNTNTTTGGGTVTQSNAMALLNTSTTTGSKAMLQSEHHGRYKAGFGGKFSFTALFTNGVAGTSQWAGILDEEGVSADFKNGFAIGYDGTDLCVSRFQNDVLFKVSRANWDDKLDGTGPSGVNLTWTNLNVFNIQYQYLGAGNIYFSVEDPVTGRPFIFHIIKYNGSFTVPSIYNPNFHATFYVNNKNTTSNISLSTASYGYFVEGFTTFTEIQQVQFSSGNQQKTAITTEVAIFTIKNKTTYANKINFIDTIMEFISVSIEASSANNLGAIRLVKNATLGGTPSYTDINTTNSVMSIDTAGTTVTGGKEIFSLQLAGKDDRILQDLLAYKIFLHPGDTITISASSANSATVQASILWRGLF